MRQDDVLETGRYTTKPSSKTLLYSVRPTYTCRNPNLRKKTMKIFINLPRRNHEDRVHLCQTPSKHEVRVDEGSRGCLIVEDDADIQKYGDGA